MDVQTDAVTAQAVSAVNTDLPARKCVSCSGKVTRQSKSGRCRSCSLIALNADGAFQARRQARLAIAMGDPGVRAKHRAGCKRGAAARMADPVKAERLREIGRAYGSKNIVHAMTPEARAKCGKATQAHHLAWCPQEYWPLNRKLKSIGYRLDDRKRIVAEAAAVDHAADKAAEAARLAAMSPFERQDALLAAGGRLTAAFRIPTSVVERTLGGVTGEIV